MELPKNITQIGVPDKKIKIYVEDYVVSYMKHFNRLASDKGMAIALYGRKKKENGVSYLFAYGAMKLDLLQKETAHLSQTQMEEIQHTGKLHFPEYTFLAYCLLNGEMVEGMYVCEEEKAHYISGYAQFYEKNDKMLAILIECRGEMIKPEIVDLEKYEIVRRKQEERRGTLIDKRSAIGIHGEKKDIESEKISSDENISCDEKITCDGKTSCDGKTNKGRAEVKNESKEEKTSTIRSSSNKGGRMVAGFLVVAVLGIFAYGNWGQQVDWHSLLTQVMNTIDNEKMTKISEAPNATKEQDAILTSANVLQSRIDSQTESGSQEEEDAEIAEQNRINGQDDIGQKQQKEGQKEQNELQYVIQDIGQEDPSGSQQELQNVGQDSIGESQSENQGVGQDSLCETQSEIQDIGQESPSESQSKTQAEEWPTAKTSTSDAALAGTQMISQIDLPGGIQHEVYTVMPGDTLNAISLQIYHTVNKVDEICSLNGIDNPDEIREGQKILLP